MSDFDAITEARHCLARQNIRHDGKIMVPRQPGDEDEQRPADAYNTLARMHSTASRTPCDA